MLVSLVSNTSSLFNSFFIHPSSNSTLLLLRNSRLFVKSSYSRNRQWSNAIVYFGLWFNIISVFWTIYYCYRYLFIFSTLFWLLCAVLLVTGFSVGALPTIPSTICWLNSLSFSF